MDVKPPAQGRAAQRRRTRAAIVDAAVRLVAQGREPTIAEVAAEADVSRRTIYLYFPTYDQLLLDATVGAMSAAVDESMAQLRGADAGARVAQLIAAIAASLDQTLPLGRRLIRLTVDAPPADDGPRRGFRRVGWIESALEPLRGELSARAFDDLVSQLALLVGWEPFIVLADTRGLSAKAVQRLVTRMARTLVAAAAVTG